MEIEIQITSQPVDAQKKLPEEFSGSAGAFAEFSGIVRASENGQKIAALEYEAYSPMAESEMRRILERLAEKFPCLAARVSHRTGIIPVGETAIHIGITAKHRAEAFALLAGFMERMKQDVRNWKRRSLTPEEVAALKKS